MDLFASEYWTELVAMGILKISDISKLSIIRKQLCRDPKYLLLQEKGMVTEYETSDTEYS